MSESALYFQSLVLLGIAAYGALAPTVKMVRNYFVGESVYVAVLFSLRIMGVRLDSTEFSAAYALCTVMMLGFGAFLTLLYARAHRSTALLFLLGMFVTGALCWVNLHGQPPQELAGWIYILEGTVLMGMGAVLGLTAPFLLLWERGPAYTLAALWIFLGVFRQLYRLYWGQPMWDLANDWLPWLATSSALLWVGILLRSQFNPLAVPSEHWSRR